MTLTRAQRWLEIKVVYWQRKKHTGIKIHMTLRTICMLQWCVPFGSSGLLGGVLVSI